MAQYKTIPSELIRSEIARRSYLDYERGKDEPEETEVEADWIAQRKKLRQALSVLTSRQRAVYVLLVGQRLSEQEIAAKLHISQQAVCDRYRRAEKKLRQFR